MTFAMRTPNRTSGAAAAVCLLSLVPFLHAQGTLADYQRAHELRTKARDLVVNTPGPATWIGDSDHFWYPKAVKGGTEFVLVDADAGAKKAAFDQDKLAVAISGATGHKYTGLKLPFAPMQGRPGARPANAGRHCDHGSADFPGRRALDSVRRGRFHAVQVQSLGLHVREGGPHPAGWPSGPQCGARGCIAVQSGRQSRRSRRRPRRWARIPATGSAGWR